MFVRRKTYNHLNNVYNTLNNSFHEQGQHYDNKLTELQQKIEEQEHFIRDILPPIIMRDVSIESFFNEQEMEIIIQIPEKLYRIKDASKVAQAELERVVCMEVVKQLR